MTIQFTKTIKKEFLKVCFLAAIILLSIYTIAKAAPPASPYNPGETLAPTCAPGSTNCTVVPPVISTRQINTTAPLLGGGDLTANRTLSMPAATATADGYLRSSDWSIFNSKEPAIAPGTTSQYWRGDKTWQTLDKAAVGLGNVENTALSTWLGSTNITTLGTITSGNWNGAIIPVTYGGTGTSTGSITGTGALTFAAGGTDQNITLTPSGTGYIILNGNVGIGTLMPSYTLDVTGTIRSTGNLTAPNIVYSVSGTANRITSTGGQNPVIDISPSYLGQTSITTLGTIITGTWQGSVIEPAHGGTGQSNYAIGDLLYASAPNTLSKLGIGTNGQVLQILGGLPTWQTLTIFETDPVWAAAEPNYAHLGQAETITGNWVNTLNPWADDEVADNLTITGGAINNTPIGQTTADAGTFTTLNATTSNLGTVASGTWQGSVIGTQYGGTGLTTFTAGGRLFYSTDASTLATLAIGPANNILTSSGTAPQWSTNIAASALPIGGNWDITSDLTIEAPTLFIGHDSGLYAGRVGIGTITPEYRLDILGDLHFTGTLQGGSVPWLRLTDFPAGCPDGQAVKVIGTTLTCVSVITNPMTTLGDIIYGGTDGVPTRLAGAVGFLKSTGAAAPSWSSINLGTADVTGILTVDKGGTGAATVGARQVLIGPSTSGAPTWRTLESADIPWPLLSTIDGLASAPAFSFSLDPDTGLYRSAVDTLAFTAGGSSRLTIGITTDGLADFARVGIGTDPRRDQLYVHGRINYAWNTFYDDFIGAHIVTGTGAVVIADALIHNGLLLDEDGECGWRMNQVTGFSTLQARAGDIGPASGEGCNTGSGGPIGFRKDENPVIETRVSTGGTASHFIKIGFVDSAIGYDTITNPVNGIFFRKTLTGNLWECVNRAGGTETSVSSGISVSTSPTSFQTLRIEVENVSDDQARFFIGGTQVCQITTNVPTVNFGWVVSNGTGDTTADNLNIDYIRVWHNELPE